MNREVISVVEVKINQASNILYISMSNFYSMTTLTIHVPDSKIDFILKLLEELNIDVKIKEEGDKADHIPNAETIKAMKELKSGKLKPTKDIKAFFESI